MVTDSYGVDPKLLSIRIAGCIIALTEHPCRRSVLLQAPPNHDESAITYWVGRQELPSIAVVEDTGFIVTWQSNGQDGDGDGIFAQRYDMDGNPLGVLPW